MKIESTPFTVTDWNLAKSEEHKGTAGTSFWKVCETGNIRVRMVEYSMGFRSDHYCPKGHVLLVLDGELEIEFKDGTTSTLTAGQSFQVSDDDINPHLAYSTKGARVFIVD
jgi:hypothetical protein